MSAAAQGVPGVTQRRASPFGSGPRRHRPAPPPAPENLPAPPLLQDAHRAGPQAAQGRGGGAQGTQC